MRLSIIIIFIALSLKSQVNAFSFYVQRPALYKSASLRLNKPAAPDASFTFSGDNCTNSTLIFSQTNPSNSNSWFWDFGNDAVPQTSTMPGPISVHYNKPGVKSVSLTVGNGVSTQHQSVLVNIRSNPVSNFTYIGALNTLPTTLILTGDTCSSCSYSWNFGDTGTVDNISVKPQTTHTFNFNGTYYVSLKTTSAAGCSATTLQAITINNSALGYTSDFTISPTYNSCVNSKVQITDMSTMPETSRKWYFGSDAVPQFANNIDTVTVYWTTPGLKKVTLIAGLASGGNTEYIKTALYEVTDYPDATFTFKGNNLSTPAIINFTANESNGYLYSWNFGDSSASNNTANSSKPTHIYNSKGTYTVSLTISHNGCTSFYASNLYIGTSSPAIIPAFSVRPGKTGCQSPSVLITDLSEEVITSYVWQFGNGATPSGASSKGPFTVSYSKTGYKLLKINVGNGTMNESAVLKIKMNF